MRLRDTHLGGALGVGPGEVQGQSPLPEVRGEGGALDQGLIEGCEATGDIAGAEESHAGGNGVTTPKGRQRRQREEVQEQGAATGGRIRGREAFAS